jgi:cobalt/nickel transport system ATP-binding protein
MNNDIIFDLHDVCYTYEHKQPALEGVTLSIRAGECIVILGSNGCGKSTLLKILDGLYFPTSGTVQAYGQTLSEAAFTDDAFNFAFRRRVGLVFQDSDVQLFSPSVWEEVAFAPLQMGLDQHEVQDRVDEALAALRIEKLRDRPPHHLSGGEKRRVALASVLALRPEVWLLDEPTAGLDPRSQSWLVDFIATQREAGKTVITATHDLSIVDAIASHVYVFGEDHRVVAQGTPERILSDHALLETCNLVHSHLHRHPETGQVHSHPHEHPLGHEHVHGDTPAPRA